MDYCHPCQRHLNGALACAGCGTPVEALSHYATPVLSGHEPDARPTTGPPAGAGRRRGRGAAPAARGKGGEPGGRPSRRRPTHRRRGRTALLVVVGALLAAGALSLAEPAIEPHGDDGASDYVRE